MLIHLKRSKVHSNVDTHIHSHTDSENARSLNEEYFYDFEFLCKERHNKNTLSRAAEHILLPSYWFKRIRVYTLSLIQWKYNSEKLMKIKKVWESSEIQNFKTEVVPRYVTTCIW